MINRSEWDEILQKLQQRVADIQAEIMLMHSDPDFISSDSSEFLDLKKDLRWAENFLFQAKGVRAYLKRYESTQDQ